MNGMLTSWLDFPPLNMASQGDSEPYCDQEAGWQPGCLMSDTKLQDSVHAQAPPDACCLARPRRPRRAVKFSLACQFNGCLHQAKTYAHKNGFQAWMRDDAIVDEDEVVGGVPRSVEDLAEDTQSASHPKLKETETFEDIIREFGYKAADEEVSDSEQLQKMKKQEKNIDDLEVEITQLVQNVKSVGLLTKQRMNNIGAIESNNE